MWGSDGDVCALYKKVLHEQYQLLWKSFDRPISQVATQSALKFSTIFRAGFYFFQIFWKKCLDRWVCVLRKTLEISLKHRKFLGLWNTACAHAESNTGICRQKKLDLSPADLPVCFLHCNPGNFGKQKSVRKLCLSLSLSHTPLSLSLSLSFSLTHNLAISSATDEHHSSTIYHAFLHRVP